MFPVARLRLPFVSHPRLPQRTGAVLVSCLLGSVACTSGQTGSPVVDNETPPDSVPSYQSPTRFRPDDGSSNGSDGLGGESGNIPIWATTPPELAALQDQTLFLTQQYTTSGGERHIAQGHEFLVYDTAQTPPEQIAQLDMAGRVLQFQVQGDQVLLAVSGVQSIEGDEIPTESTSTQTYQLVLLDVADPSAPEVVAKQDLTQEFWQFDWQGTQLTTVTATVQSQTQCVSNGSGLLGGVGEFQNWPVAASLSVFDITDNSIEPVSTQALPTAKGVLSFGDGLLSAYQGDYGEPQTMVWALASNDAIAQGTPIESTAPFVSSFRNADLMLVVTDDHNVKLVDITDPQAASEVSSLSLPSSARLFEALSPTATLLSGGSWTDGVFAAAILNHDDPTAPVLVNLSEAHEAHLASAEGSPGRVLGFYQAQTDQGGQTLRLSLWNVEDPTAPVMLSSLDTGLPYSKDNNVRNYNIDPVNQRLLYSYSIYQTDDVARHLAAISFTGDTLSLSSDVTVATSSNNAYSQADQAYVVSLDQLETVNLAEGSSTEEPLVDLSEPTVASDIQDGDTRVRLLWRAPGPFEGGTQVVPLSGMEVTTSEDTVEFPIDHLTDDVMLTDHYALALGFRNYAECEDGVASPEAFGLDCTNNSRGITVVTRTGTPEEVATIDLDSQIPALDLPDDASQRLDWEGYLPLESDRLLLVLSRHVSCHSQAACDALGIEGSVGYASPGSGPCDPEGGCEPVEPQVIMTYDGGETQALIMVLDLAAEGGPSFGDPLQVTARYDLYGEGALDLSRYLLRHGDVIGFPRAEQSFQEGVGGTLDEYGYPYAVYYLDRFELDGQSVTAMDSINTPGAPLAFADATHVVSLEPRYADDGSHPAIVHLSELRDGGAYIDQTLELGPGYRDSRTQAGRLFFVFGPEQYCAEDPTSEVFELGVGDDLTRYPSLELPFDNWGFVWWERGPNADTLRLSGGPYAGGRLTLSLPEPGSAPELISYGTQ